MIVEDVLSLDEHITVLHGKAGLQRPVNYIDIVEIPEGMHWTNPNDFIITTGYCFAESEALLELLIRTLIRRDCAGLGIKLGRYVDRIPDYIANIAEDNNFPIIRIPMHFKYREISRPLLKILEDKDKREHGYTTPEEFYLDLFNDKIRQEQEIRINATKLNLPLYAPRYILIANNIFTCREGLRTKVAQALDPVFSGLYNIICYEKQSLLQVVLQPNSDKDSLPKLGCKIKKAYTAIRSKIGDDSLMALSAPCQSLFDIPKTFYYTNLLLLQGQQAYPGQKDFFVQNHYWDLFLFENQTHYILKHLQQTYIEPLVEIDNRQHSELLLTLKTYCNNSFSITRTSQALFLHRNTVYSRIKQIESILGSLSSITLKQTVFLACKYHHIKQIEHNNFTNQSPHTKKSF